MFKTLSLAAVAALSLSTPVLAEDVTVTLTGVQARGGALLTALQTQAQFLQPAGAHGEIVRDPRSGSIRVTFRGVAPGDYSFSALHDADNDGRMTMSGSMPAEGWAMVNGESLRGPPTWDQVKFTVPASGDVALTLPMAYPR